MLDYLRYLSIGLPVILLFRLVQLGLWSINPYSGLCAYLVIGILRDLILLRPNYQTHAYTVLWESTLPMLLFGQVIAGLATYQAIAELYPKIGRFAVRLFAACLLVACLGCLAFLPLEMRRIGAEEAQLRVLFLIQRWVASILVGGLLLAVVFLSRYPAPLKRMPRNISVHTACIAAYFAAYAILYELENLQLATLCGIYVVWIVGLSQKGEVREPWPELDPAVKMLLDRRYHRAKQLLRQAAGVGGGRK
jgi:hypothetical protein